MMQSYQDCAQRLLDRKFDAVKRMCSEVSPPPGNRDSWQLLLVGAMLLKAVFHSGLCAAALELAMHCVCRSLLEGGQNGRGEGGECKPKAGALLIACCPAPCCPAAGGG